MKSPAMFRNACICALLLLTLSFPAWADWSTYKNEDLAKAGAYGWSLSLPEDWVQLPDVKPAWPQGGGYGCTQRQSTLLISRSAQPTKNEQNSLRSRRFREESVKIRDYQAKQFTYAAGTDITRYLFISTPKGEYRLELHFPASSIAEIDKILQSFTFINDPHATPEAPWATFDDSNNGYTIKYPPTVTVQKTERGFKILKGTSTLMEGKLYENSEPPAQSFRGMARMLGMHFRSANGDLAKFAPYEVGPLTGYEIMGQKPDKSYYGPLVYLPVRHARWKVLELYLHDQKAANEFFRIVNTYQLATAPQATQP